MDSWILWVLAAVALAIGEIFTPGMFFLGPVALAAVAAGVAAALGGGAAIQLVVFILGSAGTVALIRPIARRHVRMPAMLRTGTDALVGAKAIVTERVDVNGGRVRMGGEEWSARAYIEDQVLEPGARVEVVKIEGATALVYE
jgi:membrane protein implicated in regulation of membrane protease activity